MKYVSKKYPRVPHALILLLILTVTVIGWTNRLLEGYLVIPLNLENNVESVSLQSNYVEVAYAKDSPLIVPSSVAWSSLPHHRKGFGVVYCAYSKDTEKSLPKYFHETVKSVEHLKKYNPSIPVAIITNAKRQDVPTVFDHTIEVKNSMLFQGESTRPDGVFRQWFSRIYYLAHSPFEFTWYVDSHAVFVTTELEEAFREFRESSMDIAVPSSNPVSDIVQCHNFALLFRWNDRVKNLFVDWILEQLKKGISYDDQGTLCKALEHGKDKYGVQYAILSPQWALAWLSLNSVNSSWWNHRTTRVISGKAHLCHSNEGNLCQLASNHTFGPRIYYHNTTGITTVVYNEDQVNALLPYPYPSYDWQAQANMCKGVVCIPP
mmetsp:Transcript_297/g.493  ORF Transcript_297/g.493 Transcript_297/m.493 type:complete len:377 (-) Transcript_297:112-1242(-)|eukprot:CAMPEP_0176488604 /NCGR_PEP_ID=MMETSP0200_2-20121128/6805_1 /TAXON_ID=947934 /ORGANISM="Chaetoceros sp., Strain GSL56" /LENGTH=376 /DNA_ID=CAMNT_0017885613 /DNA_START=167 /DNA_END=1297 /DNA_ORIENTATION=+